MGPHRRKLVIKALFEIRGALVGISAERILRMTDAELLILMFAIEEAIESAQATEPMPPAG